MLRVVRTRKVRAIEERFYGRTARIFYVGAIRPEQASVLSNDLAVAAAESGPAHEADDLRTVPRDGQTVYGFAAGLYPAEGPTLPGQDDGS